MLPITFPADSVSMMQWPMTAARPKQRRPAADKRCGMQPVIVQPVQQQKGCLWLR